MTWVKTSLALESLKAGGVLQLRLNDGDALRSVPMSAKESGHRVLTVADNGDTSFTLTLKKDGLRSRFAPRQQDP
jgi:TusA-related sulfurtransferase